MIALAAGPRRSFFLSSAFFSAAVSGAGSPFFFLSSFFLAVVAAPVAWANEGPASKSPRTTGKTFMDLDS